MASTEYRSSAVNCSIVPPPIDDPTMAGNSGAYGEGTTIPIPKTFISNEGREFWFLFKEHHLRQCTLLTLSVGLEKRPLHRMPVISSPSATEKKPITRYAHLMGVPRQVVDVAAPRRPFGAERKSPDCWPYDSLWTPKDWLACSSSLRHSQACRESLYQDPRDE